MRSTVDEIAQRYQLMSSLLDEQQRRIFVAKEAKVFGRGGISAVSRATGVSRVTITAGLGELESDTLAQPTPLPPVRVRRLGELPKAQGYSLQANAKTLEGDRDAQFIQINACVGVALEAGEPVISVDTKKKEFVGAYKNTGREWETVGEPVKVKVHDFIDPELGRANP